MFVKKIDIKNLFYIFIALHLIIWTLIPTLTNKNLPLDTIEALAWGSNLDWGFNKHPPTSAFLIEIFYKIFGSQDWAYYLLSQLCVIIAFFIIWKLSEDFFKQKINCLVSVLLLEGIYFYNYTTPEFNVYVSEIPFWALTVFFCWKGFKNNKNSDWFLFGFFAGLGILSHYLFIYLLFAIDIFFLYMIFKKKINFKCLISAIPFLLVLLPHIIWLTENNYTTITYGLHRTGTGDQNLLDHFLHPIIFLGKQIGILIPFFVMLLFLFSKFKIKINLKDKKILFLLCINIAPIVLMFLTSLIMGVKIRTMWMTPFYLFFGVFFMYLYKKNINLNKIKYFSYLFLILFILSPITYLYVYAQNEKRTDYPGKKISKLIQEEWNKNFSNKIQVVVGSEWYAGNLIYNLKTRPKWKQRLDLEKNEGTVLIKGFNEINDCKGILYKVYNYNDVCMFGK